LLVEQGKKGMVPAEVKRQSRRENIFCILPVGREVLPKDSAVAQKKHAII
jgi:hypothetical protein